MSSVSPDSLRSLAVGGFALLWTGALVAQAPSASPFMPPASAAAAAAPATAAPIQYRGFSETSDGVKFRLVDAAKKTGTWVKLNEHDTTFDVTVKQSAPDFSTVVVLHQGRTLTLALPQSKVSSSGSAMQNMAPPPPPQMTNVPPAVTQAVVVNPTPADEQRRLEAVASEVARRRALREQASQQVNTPPSMPMAQPQPPQMSPQQQALQQAQQQAQQMQRAQRK